MYHNLGPQWGSAIPAFLTLAFAPLPFLFVKFGPALRARSKFANEAKAQMAKLQEARQNVEKKFENKHGEIVAEKERAPSTENGSQSDV